MNAKDAAVEILRRHGGGPMNMSDLTDEAISSGLVALGGKTPKATIAAQIYVEAKRADGRFERVGRGTVRLRQS